MLSGLVLLCPALSKSNVSVAGQVKPSLNARIGEASSFVFTGEEEEQANKVDLEENEYPRTSVDKNFKRQ